MKTDTRGEQPSPLQFHQLTRTLFSLDQAPGCFRDFLIGNLSNGRQEGHSVKWTSDVIKNKPDNFAATHSSCQPPKGQKCEILNLSIFRFKFCNFYVLLRVILKKRNRKSAHLVVAVSCGRRKKRKQTRPISVFFGSCSWLSRLISYLETNPTTSKFVWSLTFEKSVASSWNRETHEKA